MLSSVHRCMHTDCWPGRGGLTHSRYPGSFNQVTVSLETLAGSALVTTEMSVSLFLFPPVPTKNTHNQMDYVVRSMSAEQCS